MKRVFNFKKGEVTDWTDDPVICFLQDYLSCWETPGQLPKIKRNCKVTVIVEEECK